MTDIQERIGNNQNISTSKTPVYKTYDNLFVYSERLQNHVEQQEMDMQDYLCELMNVYQSYHDFVTHHYVVRGSKIRCRYGTKLARLDTILDHGVYMHDDPVMTCRDCNSSNIHNFGSCMCPESKYEHVLPMTVFCHPNGEVAHKASYNKFPHICVPMIDVISGWQQEKQSLIIVDGEDTEDVLIDKAALICRYGGFIQIVEVIVRENEEEQNVKYTDLGGLLFHIEMPYLDKDYIIENNERVAVKPQNANDGYVTIGAGHCIQDIDEANKYGFLTVTIGSESGIDERINEQIEKYGETLDNPAILTMEEARMLLEEDLLLKREYAQIFMDEITEETGTGFTENEKDAITSVLYNGNNARSEKSLSYYLLRHDDIGAMNILHRAIEEDWYKNQDGLFRRRLMEYNIFFNNNYTFYDSDELELLKRDVGWYGKKEIYDEQKH